MRGEELCWRTGAELEEDYNNNDGRGLEADDRRGSGGGLQDGGQISA